MIRHTFRKYLTSNRPDDLNEDDFISEGVVAESSNKKYYNTENKSALHRFPTETWMAIVNDDDLIVEDLKSLRFISFGPVRELATSRLFRTKTLNLYNVCDIIGVGINANGTVIDIDAVNWIAMTTEQKHLGFPTFPYVQNLILDLPGSDLNYIARGDRNAAIVRATANRGDLGRIFKFFTNFKDVKLKFISCKINQNPWLGICYAGMAACNDTSLRKLCVSIEGNKEELKSMIVLHNLHTLKIDSQARSKLLDADLKIMTRTISNSPNLHTLSLRNVLQTAIETILPPLDGNLSHPFRKITVDCIPAYHFTADVMKSLGNLEMIKMKDSSVFRLDGPATASFGIDLSEAVMRSKACSLSQLANTPELISTIENANCLTKLELGYGHRANTGLSNRVELANRLWEALDTGDRAANLVVLRICPLRVGPYCYEPNGRVGRVLTKAVRLEHLYICAESNLSHIANLTRKKNSHAAALVDHLWCHPSLRELVLLRAMEDISPGHDVFVPRPYDSFNDPPHEECVYSLMRLVKQPMPHFAVVLSKNKNSEGDLFKPKNLGDGWRYWFSHGMERNVRGGLPHISNYTGPFVRKK